MTTKPRVVVLGGDFAGLETAYMLRMKLHDAVDLSVVSDRDSFLFKPNTIYIPFGAEEKSLRIPLHKPLHRRDIAFHQGRVAEVDFDHKRSHIPEARRAPTRSVSRQVDFDHERSHILDRYSLGTACVEVEHCVGWARC